MKKLFVSILTIASICLGGSQVFAKNVTTVSDNSVHLTYEVNQSFTVVIPENIRINNTTNTNGAANSASAPQTVKLNGGALITGGQTLTVKLDAVDKDLSIRDLANSPKIPVSAYKDNSSTKMANTTVITGAAGNTGSDISATLTWKTTQKATAAGTFTNTVTFKVEIA